MMFLVWFRVAGSTPAAVSSPRTKSVLKNPMPQRAPTPAVPIRTDAIRLRRRTGWVKSSPIFPISLPIEARSLAWTHCSGSFTERRIQSTSRAGTAPTK